MPGPPLYTHSPHQRTPLHACAHLRAPPHTSSRLRTPPHASARHRTPPLASAHRLTPPHTPARLHTPPHTSSPAVLPNAIRLDRPRPCTPVLRFCFILYAHTSVHHAPPCLGLLYIHTTSPLELGWIPEWVRHPSPCTSAWIPHDLPEDSPISGLPKMGPRSVMASHVDPPISVRLYRYSSFSLLEPGGPARKPRLATDCREVRCGNLCWLLIAGRPQPPTGNPVCRLLDPGGPARKPRLATDCREVRRGNLRWLLIAGRTGQETWVGY